MMVLMWQKYKSGNNLPSKIYLRWGSYYFREGKILLKKVNIVLTPIRTPLQRGTPGKIIRCIPTNSKRCIQKKEVCHLLFYK